ncbi:MAG: biopolymer transporter ExbD [Akkermansia sp.]|nr:biopolymer transporter ExbD [Akkermansia sp.]
MKIYTRKAVMQGIPIVPMLDILTILLIFFIVHTEFKRQVNVLKLDLPRTEHLAGEMGDNNQVLLEVGEDGRLALNGREIASDELPAAVNELVKNNPHTRVQVAAAEGSSLGKFIEVLDFLTAAGLNVEEVPVRIEHRK